MRMPPFSLINLDDLMISEHVSKNLDLMNWACYFGRESPVLLLLLISSYAKILIYIGLKE